MSKSLDSPRQKFLAELIVIYRKKAGLTQVEVAERLGRYQSFVTHLESGQRRVDVVELFEIAKAYEFDPAELVRNLKKVGD